MRASAVNHLDPVIRIPATLSYGETSGCWASRYGVAKLQRKYGEFPHSREFDGYAAARRAQDPAWRNRIEMADLLVTWLMQSQIERRPGAIEAVMEHRTRIEAALAGVPDNLALEAEEIPDQTWPQLESLFRAFRVRGVGLATMTKVLCMKRPALIPMMDSHVMGFLFEKEWPLQDGHLLQDDAAAGVVGMKRFRELMQHGDNLRALVAIRHELSPCLARLEVSSRVPPGPSLVRVLDSLLWYDWGGCAYFGGLKEGLSVPDLLAMLPDCDHAVRWRAAQALGNAGLAAQEAIPALQTVLTDEYEDSLVRWWAGWALKRINPDAAAEARVPEPAGRPGDASATTNRE
jgi:hypothetical protein